MENSVTMGPNRQPITVLDVLAWICIRDRRLLCVRSQGNDVFYLPGGKREPGESDWEGISREVKEELSIALIPGTLIEALTIEEEAHGFSAPTRVIMKCFRADYHGQIVPASEIEEIAWLSFADRRKCAPATQRVLEAMAAQNAID
ncbi:MAG: NUDIX domain-containing protein [Cyanobacteria bacterium J06614_10]